MTRDASSIPPFPQSDIDVLRSLARRKRELADSPRHEALRQAWRDHNALRGDRPMVLCFPEGAWRETLAPADLQCVNDTARGWEMGLRMQLYSDQQLRHDAPMEPVFNIGWRVERGDYGVDIPQHKSEEAGSYVWDPPVKDIDRDMDQLRFRQPTVDRPLTLALHERAKEVFDGILDVRLRGPYWWTLGMTWEVAKLIGLEQLMLLMLDNPAGVHRMMAWMRDEHLHWIDWFEREGLLSPINQDDYVGSGGMAYTDELPQPDWREGDPVRLIDLWGFGESQETVGVGPAMFEEFILPYQVTVLERFGLNCYGCCEGLHSRIDSVLRDIPRLRRVSVSPWADQPVMAEKLAGRCIYSRKPNPTLVCGNFHDDAIRQDIRETLRCAGEQPLEIILKDTHTVLNEPHRLVRWVELAHEEVDRYLQRRGSRVGVGA